MRKLLHRLLGVPVALQGLVVDTLLLRLGHRVAGVLALEGDGVQLASVREHRRLGGGQVLLYRCAVVACRALAITASCAAAPDCWPLP